MMLQAARSKLSSLLSSAPSLASLERDARSDTKISAPSSRGHIPAPLKQTARLYLLCLALALVARAAEFSSIVLLVLIGGQVRGLFLAALSGLLSLLASAVVLPRVLAWQAQSDRLEAAKGILTATAGLLAGGYFLSAILASRARQPGEGGEEGDLNLVWGSVYVLYVLPFLWAGVGVGMGALGGALGGGIGEEYGSFGFFAGSEGGGGGGVDGVEGGLRSGLESGPGSRVGLGSGPEQDGDWISVLGDGDASWGHRVRGRIGQVSERREGRRRGLGGRGQGAGGVSRIDITHITPPPQLTWRFMRGIRLELGVGLFVLVGS